MASLALATVVLLGTSALAEQALRELPEMLTPEPKDGGMAGDALGHVLQEHRREVRFCYLEALRRHQHPGDGKLSLILNVTAEGVVRDAAIREDGLEQPGINKCVLRRVKAWTFPSGKVDTVASFSVAFREAAAVTLLELLMDGGVAPHEIRSENLDDALEPWFQPNPAPANGLRGN